MRRLIYAFVFAYGKNRFSHDMAHFNCSYRTREEIQEVRERRDPIINLKNRLLDSNLVTAEEIKVTVLLYLSLVDSYLYPCKLDKL